MSLKEEIDELIKNYKAWIVGKPPESKWIISTELRDQILVTISKHLPEKRLKRNGEQTTNIATAEYGWNAYHDEVNKLLTTNKKGAV